HNSPDELLLHIEQATRFVGRIDIGAGDLAQAVDVVVDVERAQLPLRLLVEGAEEIDLHDHTTFARLGDKVLEAAKVRVVEASEIELGAAQRVAGRVAARPRREETALGGGQGVLGNMEGPCRLDIGAGEGARQVEAIASKCIEILAVVKVEIENGAIMLAAGH